MKNIIVACGRKRVIGKNGQLPWNIKEDWEHFLNLTRHGTLVMGRRCFAELGAYSRNRKVIVLSRNPGMKFSGARKASSLLQALDMANDEVVWICGGEKVYEEALLLADRLYLTLIDADFKGDVFFPPWEKIYTEEISRRESKDSGYRLTFLTLGRRTDG